MKVSASFLSSRDLVKDLKLLDLTDVDYIHLDIMDGKFVSNKTMPYSELKHISKYTSKRLDVHLMVEDPEKYIPLTAHLFWKRVQSLPIPNSLLFPHSTVFQNEY